jgi:hypothetical protein
MTLHKKIKDLFPNEQIHTLPDGVNSPHETEYDRGWNESNRICKSKIPAMLEIIREEIEKMEIYHPEQMEDYNLIDKDDLLTLIKEE